MSAHDEGGYEYEEDMTDDGVNGAARNSCAGGPISSRSIGVSDHSSGQQPLSGDSYHSDPEDRKSSGTKDRHGRTIQRRPPRPTQSASSGRKPPTAGGSMNRRRQTRRVAAAEKQWGNASMPSITVRDIMGGEKKATAVGMVASGHSRQSGRGIPQSPGAGKDSKAGAEEKRNIIRSRWKEKQSRQSDVKNSLAQFLAGGESEAELDGELEDEELISDIDDDDEGAYRPTSTHSLRLDAEAESDDNKSRSRDNRRRLKNTSRTTDGNVTDGDGGGSSHSRSRKSSRRRLKKPAGGGEDDDRSVGSTKSSRGRRHASRRGSRHGGDSVDGEQMQNRQPDDGQQTIPKSSSSRRKLSEGTGAPPKPRSTRRKGAADDDDRSVGSRKSVGGRRRRQQSQRTKSTSSHGQDRSATSSPKRPSATNVDGHTPPVSPLSSKPNSEQSLTESPGRGEHKDKLASLSKHFEANPKPKTTTDPEEQSEESSRFSSNYEQPASILQFDPTNANNITTIRQNKANIKSEKFRLADGTESELHISELTGLPTFEAMQSTFHDSQNSDYSEPDARPHSTNSFGSMELDKDYDNPRGAKSMSNLGFNFKTDLAAQNAGQKSDEPGVNQAGRKGRGVPATPSGMRRAFLNRVLKPERNEKPPRTPSTENGTFHQSMQGFFGTWNKKGECEDGEDEDEQPVNRFFRKREGVEHQALDDYGSDED